MKLEEQFRLENQASDTASIRRIKEYIRPTIEMYGSLAPKRLHEIMAIEEETVTWGDVVLSSNEHRALINQTHKKAAKIEQEARAGKFEPHPEAVELTDDFVVTAVHFLCNHDGDRASSRNRVGWNQSDSGKGHVANALIKNGERDLGIVIGRSLIGKYLKTQLANLRV